MKVLSVAYFKQRGETKELISAAAKLRAEQLKHIKVMNRVEKAAEKMAKGYGRYVDNMRTGFSVLKQGAGLFTKFTGFFGAQAV